MTFDDMWRRVRATAPFAALAEERPRFWDEGNERSSHRTFIRDGGRRRRIAECDVDDAELICAALNAYAAHNIVSES